MLFWINIFCAIVGCINYAILEDRIYLIVSVLNILAAWAVSNLEKSNE